LKKSSKKASLKRELPGSEDNGTSAKKSNLIEVTLQMMKDRNEEFDSKMNSIERASKELRYGAQLELLFFFDKTGASCKISGEQLNTEKLTLSHLQQKLKVMVQSVGIETTKEGIISYHLPEVEYNNLKTVLNPPDNNMLTLCLQKAIKSEFTFAREQTFPVPVNY